MPGLVYAPGGTVRRVLPATLTDSPTIGVGLKIIPPWRQTSCSPAEGPAASTFVGLCPATAVRQVRLSECWLSASSSPCSGSPPSWPPCSPRCAPSCSRADCRPSWPGSRSCRSGSRTTCDCAGSSATRTATPSWRRTGRSSLLVLLQVWLVVTYFGVRRDLVVDRAEPARAPSTLSGSSLTTLGFQHPPGLPGVFIAVAEAISGLVLLALLITYLPALYSAFKTREFLVAKLEVRAGQPPSGSPRCCGASPSSAAWTSSPSSGGTGRTSSSTSRRATPRSPR